MKPHRIFLSVFVFFSLAALGACGRTDTSLPLDTDFDGVARLSSLSECQGQPTSLAGQRRPGDELSVTVTGGQVRFSHSGAVFNCCLDSISLCLVRWGNVVRIVEKSHESNPCHCICLYTVEGEILGLASGRYRIEVAPDSLGDCAWCGVEVNVRAEED